jgi:hypothetical protein
MWLMCMVYPSTPLAKMSDFKTTARAGQKQQQDHHGTAEN